MKLHIYSLSLNKTGLPLKMSLSVQLISGRQLRRPPFETPDLDVLGTILHSWELGMDGKTLTSESHPLKFYKKVNLVTFSLMNAPQRFMGPRSWV